MSRRTPTYSIAFAALLIASPAFACSGPTFKLSGDFQSGEKAWGESDGQFQLKGAEAVFTAQVGTQSARWNAGTPLTDLDACVTIAMPQVTADATKLKSSAATIPPRTPPRVRLNFYFLGGGPSPHARALRVFGGRRTGLFLSWARR